MKKIISTPPTYFYLAVIFIVLFSFLLPRFNLISKPYNYLGFALIILGIWLTIWPWLVFKKHQTPENFSHSTTLVTVEPYKFSRNPMYLGMLLLLIGLTILLQNVLSLIFPVLFFLIIHLMFIPYEEEKMLNSFGSNYLIYKHQIRKWL